MVSGNHRPHGSGPVDILASLGVERVRDGTLTHPLPVTSL